MLPRYKRFVFVPILSSFCFSLSLCPLFSFLLLLPLFPRVDRQADARSPPTVPLIVLFSFLFFLVVVVFVFVDALRLHQDVRKLDLDSVGSFFVVPRHIAMRTAEGSEEEDEASDEDLKGEMAFEMYKSIAELSHFKTLDDIHVGKAPFCPDSPDGICYRIPSSPSKPTPSHAVTSSSSSTPTTSSPSSTSSSSSASASSSSGVPAKRTFSKLDAISKRGLLYAMV